MVVSGGGVVDVVRAAASVVVVAKEVSPAIVVSDLGTFVHRFPFIEVISNPAGRFAFIGMAKRSNTSRYENVNQPSRDISSRGLQAIKLSLQS